MSLVASSLAWAALMSSRAFAREAAAGLLTLDSLARGPTARRVSSSAVFVPSSAIALRAAAKPLVGVEVQRSPCPSRRGPSSPRTAREASLSASAARAIEPFEGEGSLYPALARSCRAGERARGQSLGRRDFLGTEGKLAADVIAFDFSLAKRLSRTRPARAVAVARSSLSE